MLATFTVQHFQPWVKESIRSNLAEKDIVAVTAGPYIALHARRGDKLRVEATLTEARVGCGIVQWKQCRAEHGGDAGAPSLI